MKKLGMLVAALIGMLLINTVPAFSHDEYDFIELTENATMDRAPRINDAGQIVWMELDDYQYDIVFYDGTNPPFTIASDIYPDGPPLLNNAGQVVWHGWDGNDYEIYLYDNSTNTVKQLTNDDYDDMYPNINDAGQVVWVHSYLDLGTGKTRFSVMLRDPAGSEVILGDIEDYCRYWPTPQINAAGQVVWVGAYDLTNMDIFFYGGAGQPTKQLTNNQVNDCSPSLNSNGEIVWQSGGMGDSQIMHYSASTGVTQQLTNDYSFAHRTPKINDAGQIIWEGTGGGLYGVYLFAGGVTTTLMEQPKFVGAAQLNAQGKVVWQALTSYLGTGYYNDQIFVYEGTLPPRQLTTSAYQNKGPQINAVGDIVWFEYEPAEHETEILLAKAVPPSQLIDQLIQHVKSLNLPNGLDASLVAKLELFDKAYRHRNDHDQSAANNLLESFIKEVQANSGKKIAPADATALIAEAQKIINLLNIEEGRTED
jgi:hypothetical protein